MVALDNNLKGRRSQNAQRRISKWELITGRGERRNDPVSVFHYQWCS